MLTSRAARTKLAPFSLGDREHARERERRRGRGDLLQVGRLAPAFAKRRGCALPQDMRILPTLVTFFVGSLALISCGGDGATDDLGGMGGSSGGDSGGNTGSGGQATGGATGTGGGSGSDAEFFDLTGRIRFANFISDGEEGLAVDVYWGSSFGQSEFMGTVAYAEVTDFVVPRFTENTVLDEDETNYFVLPAGSTETSEVLAAADEAFASDTQLTVALSAAEPIASLPGLHVSSTTFFEHEISTPPAGMAHVYGWDNPWDPIEGFSFALVGADDLCDPEFGEVTGGNLGTPAIIPEGATGVTLFDANTECASGGPEPEGSIEAGHSYVLLGEAETYDLGERTVVLLEVGAD